MKKPLIAVDIDDVLSRSAEGFATYSNQRWQSDITADDYSEEWAVVWKVPLEQAIERSIDFHKDIAHSAYLPVADALPALQKLADSYDLVTITSRREVVKPATDAWIARYFPGIFKAAYYAGVWDTDGHVHDKLQATKAVMCRELGAGYLIDDQLKHCIAAGEVGVQTLLFGNYPWNKPDGDLPHSVTRVADWHAIEEYFGV